MEPSAQTDRVVDYLARLRPHLDDLDPGERAEVLDELGDALREVAAENEGPLQDVLGPPAEYVAAYRASAGLQQGQERSRRLRTRTDRLREHVRAQPWWPHVRALLVLLRPAWWTLRGAVLGMLVGGIVLGLFRPSEVTSLPAIICIVGAVAASLAVGHGRRDHRTERMLVMLANLLAVIATLSFMDLAGQVRQQGWEEGHTVGLQAASGADPAADPAAAAVGHLTLPDGELVTNIHPYTRDGEPLDDILLFDGAGQPLTPFAPGNEVFADIETVYERDADGQPITNLYPLQQFTLEYDDSGALIQRRARRAPTIVLPPGLLPDATASPAPSPQPTPPPRRRPGDASSGTG